MRLIGGKKSQKHAKRTIHESPRTRFALERQRKKRHSRPSGSIVITGFGATTGFLPEFEEPEFELAADRFVESDFCISMYASGRYPH